MSRSDISDKLIHFTRGSSAEEAFALLNKIVRDRKLFGGTGFIRGAQRCVCFSEAPIASLAAGLLNDTDFSRYSPFGIMVAKRWLFELGGRPVIYGTEQELSRLGEDSRWRQVLYEIRDGFGFSDFTWEREWRVRTDVLEFNEESAQIVVPDSNWAYRLVSEFNSREDGRVMEYSQIFGQSLAELYRGAFRWTVYSLKSS